jgi:hypothetical protein
MKDMELEDKDIKEDVESIETEEIDEEQDNIAKHEGEGEEEEQESDDDIAGTGLEEEDIMIDDNYSSDDDDDVPLELPFDNPMPFP